MIKYTDYVLVDFEKHKFDAIFLLQKPCVLIKKPSRTCRHNIVIVSTAVPGLTFLVHLLSPACPLCINLG